MQLLTPAVAQAAKGSAQVNNNKEEAAAISQIADEKNKAGDFAMCGEMFQKAYRLDPSYLAYLFSAARCEQKAGQLDAAERDYRQFVARTPDGDKLAEKAKKYLDEILEERKKAAPTEPKTTEPKTTDAKPSEPAKPIELPVVHQPAPESPRPLAAWTATFGGAAVAVVGAALLGVGLAQRSSLQAELTASSDSGLITSTTPTAAHDRETAYQNRLNAGAVTLGVGAVVTGLGLWWWHRAPSAVQTAWLAPVPGGAQLGIRF